MTNRIVILSCVIFALALSINYVLDSSSDSPLTERKNDPDLYMHNASINQFDDKGALHHKIYADRFTHFPITDVTTMLNPTLALVKENNTSPWKINSEEGRLLPTGVLREEVVELWDNVLASRNGQAGKFITISTQSLTVYPDRHYAETDTKVFIDNETGRTTAAGMKAFLDTGKFQFYSSREDRVNTIYLPVMKHEPAPNTEPRTTGSTSDSKQARSDGNVS